MSTHDHGTGNVSGGTGGTGGHNLEDDFGVYDVHYYRGHFNSHASRPPTQTYEHARSGYALGHAAAANPSYQGSTFDEVDTELRATYKPAEETTTYDTVREYARHAFDWRTILGGLALAAGGWWAGKQLHEAVSGMNEEDETHYRTHFQSVPVRSPSLTYDRARVGYSLGHVAARNPGYSGRSFDDVEPELRRGFTGSYATEYDTLRDYCRYGYERASGLGGAGLSGRGGTSTGGSSTGGSSTGLGGSTGGTGGLGGTSPGTTGGIA